MALICSQCNEKNPDSAIICEMCGLRLDQPVAPQPMQDLLLHSDPVPQGPVIMIRPCGPLPVPHLDPQYMSRPDMGGNNAPVVPVDAIVRCWALILDTGIIMSVVIGVLFFLLMGSCFVDTKLPFLQVINSCFAISFLFGGIAFIFYKPIMESSGSQATIGKLIIGTKVTDMDGGRIGFGKAFYRHSLSSLIVYIGVLPLFFVMKAPELLIWTAFYIPIAYGICLGVSIGTNAMKQGFHDRAAGTMVVRR
ncbi:MAG: RDD family protein [bacterium]